MADKEDADADAYNGSSAAVVVKLKHSGAEVTIHRGQWVATPMGEGIVERIFPRDQKVKIKLPFGMLYAHLSRMVCWGLSPDVIEDDMTSNKDTTTAASVVEASKNDVDAMVVEGDESGPIGPAKAVRIGETLDLTSNKAMLLHWKTPSCASPSP